MGIIAFGGRSEFSGYERPTHKIPLTRTFESLDDRGTMGLGGRGGLLGYKRPTKYEIPFKRTFEFHNIGQIQRICLIPVTDRGAKFDVGHEGRGTYERFAAHSMERFRLSLDLLPEKVNPLPKELGPAATIFGLIEEISIDNATFLGDFGPARIADLACLASRVNASLADTKAAAIQLDKLIAAGDQQGFCILTYRNELSKKEKHDLIILYDVGCARRDVIDAFRGKLRK